MSLLLQFGKVAAIGESMYCALYVAHCHILLTNATVASACLILRLHMLGFGLSVCSCYCCKQGLCVLSCLLCCFPVDCLCFAVSMCVFALLLFVCVCLCLKRQPLLAGRKILSD